MIEDLGRYFRDERRKAEIFRKGLVTAVDTSVSPFLATINGRRMPYIDDQIAVGDVVFYVDQPDPFAWARFEGLGEIDGGFSGRILAASRNTAGGFAPQWDDDLTPALTALSRAAVVARFGPFDPASPFFADWTTGLPVGVFNMNPEPGISVSQFVSDIRDGVELFGSQASLPTLPITDPFSDRVHEVLNLGGWHSRIIHDVIGATVVPGAHPTVTGNYYVPTGPYTGYWEPNGITGSWHVLWGTLVDFVSIRSAAYASAPIVVPSGGSALFPAVVSPGPNWVIVYLVAVEPIGSGAASRGRLTFDWDTNPTPSPTNPRSVELTINRSYFDISDFGLGGPGALWHQTQNAGIHIARVTSDVDATVVLDALLIETTAV